MWKILGFALCFISAAVPAQTDREVLYQVSTIDALSQGVFDGETTCGRLKQHGDLGIGTFNGLDGELVALDGAIYDVKADGAVIAVSDEAKVPFAAITFFDPDRSVALERVENLQQLEQQIEQALPTKNLFYAFRIDGVFTYLKTRSVPKQQPPYPLLVEAVKRQAVFTFENTTGTLVGFRCPDFVKGVNVPGYHWHFLARDRKQGGHLLDCRLEKAAARIDVTPQLLLALPEGGAFEQTDLTKDQQAAIHLIEKGNQ